MADGQQAQDRPVHRCYQRHRLEEQLWSLAYQQVWPVIRGKPKASGAQTNQQHGERVRGTSPIARRA